MSLITIPVDAQFIILERTENYTDRNEINSGGLAQTQFVRRERKHTVDSGWNVARYNAAIAAANAIWEPAEIRFRATEPTTRCVQPPMDFTYATDGAYQYLMNHTVGQDGRITVLLVQKFPRWDQGGDADRGTCIVPSLLNGHDPGRVLAHEFGHLLGLGHVETDQQTMQNLMRQDSVAGSDLTDEQIARARQSGLAQRTIPPSNEEDES